MVTLKNIFDKYRNDLEYQKELRISKPYFDIMIQVLNIRTKKLIDIDTLAKKAGIRKRRLLQIAYAEKDYRLSELIKIAEALNTELKIQLKEIENERL